MMKINYGGNIQILVDATQKANDLLNGNKLYDLISQKPSFDFSTATGQQIAQSMRNCSTVLHLLTFKKFITRELGYEDPKRPADIHINIAGNKLNRSLGSIVGTLIHESVHAADANDPTLSYPHNGNLAAGNENSAPYWIGNLVVQLIDAPTTPVDINNITASIHAPDDLMPDRENNA
jgi:hypothetical protein